MNTPLKGEAMTDLLKALPHLVMALAVIGAMSALMAIGVVGPAAGVPIIAAAGGFTLGGTIGLASPSPSGTPAVASSVLTPSLVQKPQPATVTAAPTPPTTPGTMPNA